MKGTYQMLKRILTFSIVAMILTMGAYQLNATFNNQYAVWKENWGFSTPNPSKSQVIFEKTSSFLGRSLAYVVLDYNRKQFETIRYQGVWKTIDANTMQLLQEKIEEFSKDAKEKGHAKNKIFPKHPIQYQVGDLYFYKYNPERSSYFLAILDVRNHRLYTLETLL
ncbi:hypothetical protein [Priestia koreensis]|uniref:Uncharacterized protein n=2 Tax=Priestia koreensis TaxID=284581 RepID=A0A0M0L9D0_9BACI|nr:hypothetical protein [Priestia koreensis]KOO47644.1 hypothetical protein AMD01_06315 [Priestia koreensis]UNL82889.1 hypothetical protein IE339_11770 [Priestia koreensis]